MKKLTAILLLMCMLLPMTANAEVWATLKQSIATRTGPGTKYTEPGGFLSGGDQVIVRSKVWDSVNEIWWVQVEFTPYYGYNGDKIRAYTGAWRMNVDLSRVPEEYALQTCRVIKDADAFAGPWYNGFVAWNDTIYAGTTATLLEVEDGFAHIECWNSWQGSWWRGWVKLSTLSCASSYSSYGYYGFADDISSSSHGYWPSTPAPTKSPSTYYGSTYGYPVGQMCTVIASSAHARSGPGTQYDTAAYVYDGERYEILECTTGSTGKDWYKIYVGKEYRTYAWISSGLCTID